MKKRNLLLGWIILIAWIFPWMAYGANQEIKVYLDEMRVEYDQKPFIQKNRVLVPLRKTMEVLQANVQWDPVEGKVTVIRNNETVTFWVGKSTVTSRKNGVAETHPNSLLDEQPAVIVNDRVMVPLRFIVTEWDYSVGWTAEDQSVLIFSGEYKLVWNDEFSGRTNSPPNPAKWMYERLGTSGNGWGNGSLNAYRDQGFVDGSGNLVIRAKKENYQGAPYTSVRLATRDSGNWKYGRFVIRAKLPKGGKGIWPAIWMMPTDNQYGEWPQSGEVDIMEMIGSDPTNVLGSIHYTNPGSREDQRISNSFRLGDTGYHIYALEWDEQQFRWYVDGKLYQTVNKADWNKEKGNAPFDQRFYLILNMAVGGTWPGNPDESVSFPQDMLVDYVRVFQK